jgi:hypothetical protein
MGERREGGAPSWAVPALVAAMALAAALLAWEGRDTTWFNGDELQLFTFTSWSPGSLLTPQNGHLIVVSRLLGHATLSLFGDYSVFRGISIACVLGACGMFFAYARRRVGGELALAATLPLLFLGSGWEILLFPIGALQLGIAIASGIGALLLAEDGGGWRLAGACALLVVSVASFTIGLCFVLAVAVRLVLEDRANAMRRAWIVVVPALLWLAWWVWSRKFHQDSPVLANVLLAPLTAAAELGDVAGSLTGLIRSFDFSPGLAPQPVRTLDWSPLLAAGAAAGLYVLARRARPDWRRVAPAAITLASYWIFLALASQAHRPPDASRYMFPGAVLVLLLTVEVGRGVRAGRTALAVIGGVLALTIVSNVAIMRDAGTFFRDYTRIARTDLGMIDLAGPAVRPDFAPSAEVPEATSSFLPVYAKSYLRGAAEFGQLGFSPGQVAAEDEASRESADVVLSTALGLTLSPGTPPGLSDCRRVTGEADIGGGGIWIRPKEAATLKLARFGDSPAVDLGQLAAGRPSFVAIAPDSYPRPWRAYVASSAPARVCRLLDLSRPASPAAGG